MTLRDALKEKADVTSFHTPGHFGHGSIDFSMDVTELPYSDNLLEAEGALKALEEKTAKAYGVSRALISVNGATNCILTALYALRHEGSFLIFAPAHKSVFNGAALAGARCYATTETSDLTKEALLERGVGTVVVTSPDYFGKTLELDFFRRLCDEAGALLVIDASHGSHFQFCDKLPVSATKYGDVVIHSLHKTLPVATGGAVLLLKKEDERFLAARRTFHSTSPSYITLVTIEQAIDSALTDGQAQWSRAVDKVKEFSTSDLGAFSVRKTDDPTRLVLESDYSGSYVYGELLKKGFALEMSAGNAVVAIVGPGNCDRLPALAQALRETTGEKAKAEATAVRYGLKEVTAESDAAYEEIPLCKATGRKSLRCIGLYPPGTPLIFAGEIITESAINTLKQNKGTFGLENDNVLVLK